MTLAEEVEFNKLGQNCDLYPLCAANDLRNSLILEVQGLTFTIDPKNGAHLLIKMGHIC